MELLDGADTSSIQRPNAAAESLTRPRAPSADSRSLTMSKPATPPRLEHLPNGTHHLLVDGAPYLLRAAELNNSSLSSGRYMMDVWPRLVHGNVNTVLGSVSWEQIEPDEGEYEFRELDEVLRDAREWGLKVVLLWFGAYKNGERYIDSFGFVLAHLFYYFPCAPLRPALPPRLWTRCVGVCASMTPAHPPRSHVNIRASVGQARLEALPSGANDLPVRQNRSVRCPRRLF